MLVIPAIDLLDGRCVRLRQGDFAQSTTYSDDPLAVARRWQSAGAEWLHVVDLNGAREGAPHHLRMVGELRAAAEGVRIELGGGLRSLEAIAQGLEVADRVVLGTAAIKQPELLKEALARFGQRLAVGIDARDGLVATEGWESTTTRPAFEVGQEMREAGVRTLIFTDVETDGTLAGPNLEALTRMRSIPGVELIASGGVGSIAHLRQIAKLGVEGCIVGKALYDGSIDLTRAMHEVEESTERYEW